MKLLHYRRLPFTLLHRKIQQDASAGGFRFIRFESVRTLSCVEDRMRKNKQAHYELMSLVTYSMNQTKILVNRIEHWYLIQFISQNLQINFTSNKSCMNLKNKMLKKSYIYAQNLPNAIGKY